MKEINILDKEYAQWVKSLVAKYRQSQVKAAVKVNTEVLRFYWELGKDIVERDAENQYGSRFYASLSRDLKEALQTDGFSERNLRYMKSFYLLYNGRIGNLPQVVANSNDAILPQVVANSNDAILPQVVAELFMVPWGHHRYIIDKCTDDPDKALILAEMSNEGLVIQKDRNWYATNSKD